MGLDPVALQAAHELVSDAGREQGRSSPRSGRGVKNGGILQDWSESIGRLRERCELVAGLLQDRDRRSKRLAFFGSRTTQIGLMRRQKLEAIGLCVTEVDTVQLEVYQWAPNHAA